MSTVSRALGDLSDRLNRQAKEKKVDSCSNIFQKSGKGSANKPLGFGYNQKISVFLK